MSHLITSSVFSAPASVSCPIVSPLYLLSPLDACILPTPNLFSLFLIIAFSVSYDCVVLSVLTFPLFVTLNHTPPVLSSPLILFIYNTIIFIVTLLLGKIFIMMTCYLIATVLICSHPSNVHPQDE